MKILWRVDRSKVRKSGWGLGLMLLLVALSAACASGTPPVVNTPSVPAPAPLPAASRGLIAYVGQDGNIYTIDPDGKQPTAITQDAIPNAAPDQAGRIYQYPTWAPTEQTLAFMGFSRSPQSGTQASLITASSDGKKRVEAFTSQDAFPFYLFWSPNSQYITFLSNSSGGIDLELHLSVAAGGDHRIIGSGQPFYWDWSPDTRSIITHTGGASSLNPDARMALYPLDVGAQKKELDLKPGSFQAPDWSPGGDEMVLIAENETGAGELVLAGQDGAVKRVLAAVNNLAAFAWSPQGKRLAYMSEINAGTAGSSMRLAVIDPAQPDQEKEAAQGPLAAFFWSPNGQKIAIFSVALNTPGGIFLNVAQTAPQFNLAIQIYSLESGETRQIAIFKPTEAFLQIFPFFDQYQRSVTLWSPDSQNLVFAGVDSQDRPVISVVGIDGGGVKKIADGDLAFWSWR